jgi:uncharacterized protein (TIGR03083 family)
VDSPARPATVLDKSDVLDGLLASWDAIDELMTGLPDAQWTAPTPLPGWCVHDVVAHVIGTESMLSGVATPELGADVATFSHVRNPIGELNECWVQHLRGETGDDVLARFRDVTAKRRATLTGMTEEVWNAVTATPAGPDTYGRFMRVRTFDCWMHQQDIRQALSRPPSDGDLEGPTSRLALDEIGASMGFVVGKLGGAPEGSRVAIELTGPLRRTFNVDVSGRARVVADFGGVEPTATITLDGLLFTQLAGGRTTVTRHPDAVRHGGDVEVGTRVVENLNYVI